MRFACSRQAPRNFTLGADKKVQQTRECPEENQTKGAFTKDDFAYLAAANAYRCPAGKILHYAGLGRKAQQHLYRSTPTQYASCPEKSKCTRGTVRKLGVS